MRHFPISDGRAAVPAVVLAVIYGTCTRDVIGTQPRFLEVGWMITSHLSPTPALIMSEAYQQHADAFCAPENAQNPNVTHVWALSDPF